jgi:P27 family predicted phage terminase small subunit
MSRRQRPLRIGLRYRPLSITPPPGLTGAARQLWERIAPELAEARTHTSIDAPLLEAYCQAQAELQAYYAYTNAIGLERATRLGTARISSQLCNAVTRLSDRLGLNPRARRKIERHLVGETVVPRPRN